MSQRKIRRALVSVFDKDGVVELCRALVEREIEILSSGGTSRLLSEHGIPVKPVSEHTGFPEMLGGRVKTLHPAIHAGILARRSDEAHRADLERAGLVPIDLVVVNLYPFRRTIADPDATPEQAVEMIDIGGPTMVRAAAKNFADVAVVVDPRDYGGVAAEIGKSGGLSEPARRALAVKAFAHTAEYDAAVHAYLARTGQRDDDDAALPDVLRIEAAKRQDLRYGENPHQAAAFYVTEEGPSIGSADQLQGKPLSFNNILDLDAALALAAELDETACAIIKHGNPCGAALGDDVAVAFERALSCDPLSAFGGVIAFNRNVSGAAATKIAETFFEAIVAPAFDDDARAALKRKKKLRLLAVGELAGFERKGHDLRRVTGGLLAQDWDASGESVRASKVVTRRAPDDIQWRALEFAWKVCKHVKSNAIVYASAERTLGIGAGQMSRVDSARIGVEKAQSSLDGCVMASDAFFPFRDGIDAAAEAGVAAIVQPGGSIRDREVIDAADEHGMAMVFTGHRHFRH